MRHLFLGTVFIVSSFAAAADEQNTGSFSAAEKEHIVHYYRTRHAQKELYQQYHPRAESKPEKGWSECPVSFKRNEIVALNLLADTQLLPPALEQKLVAPKGSLTLVNGRCVFRLKDQSRAILDWVNWSTL